MANVVGIVRERREAYWRKQIEVCESSGLSIARYCREQGISAAQYHWWKSELKRRAATRSVALFTEVRPVPRVEAVVTSTIEVALSGERVVRVRPGFDAATLAGVVQVLEGLGC
jgi:hypothetical protein